MRLAIVTLLVAGACAHRPTETICAGTAWTDLTTRQATPAMPQVVAKPDVTIGSVEVRGVDPELATSLRGALETRPGIRLADAPLRHDLAALYQLGVVDTAHVEVDGGTVAFVVTLEPTVGRVVHGELHERLRWLTGTPFEARRVQRMAEAIERNLVADGHLDAQIAVRRAARSGSVVDLCVASRPGPRVAIGNVTFVGARALTPAALLHEFKDAADVNHPGGRYDEDALATDLLYVSAAYWERGMLNVKVGEPKLSRRGAKLDIAIPITEGPVFQLGSITAPLGFPAAVGLRSGELATRSKLTTANNAMQAAIGEGANVYIRTAVDLDRKRIDISWEVQWRSPWDAVAFWHSRLF